MKEFHINQYLSVRLEHEETKIYVVGKPFILCKFLLINIPITEISTFDEIESIDEAAEKVDELVERKIRKIEIPPEVEFWGHCSNLQVWYEYGYDTRLIHSNLAFPLLKKLTEVDDPLAKEVFKTEILKRYKNGTERTRDYLEAEGFLEYISLDEQLNILLDSKNFIALIELVEEIWTDRDPYTLILDLIGVERVKIENRKVIELDLSGLDLELEEFPKAIFNLGSLKIFYLGWNHITEIPEEINKLSSLRELAIRSNEITHIPDSICEITSLEKLFLGGNKINALPENIGNLINLKVLRLESNQLKVLPESSCKLKSLENLTLSNNKLDNLPKSFCKLKSLKRLSLFNNNLKELPECIGNIQSLEYLDISSNPLTENPQIIEKLKHLNIKKVEFE